MIDGLHRPPGIVFGEGLVADRRSATKAWLARLEKRDRVEGVDSVGALRAVRAEREAELGLTDSEGPR